MRSTATEKIIIGAGRQAVESFYLIKDINPTDDITAFAVDSPEEGEELMGKKVVALLDLLNHYKNNPFKPAFIVAIGAVDINKRLVQTITQAGFPFFSAINPQVVVDRQLFVGEGVTIAAGTVITCNTHIGNYSLINIGCTISHDCIIGDYVNISPGCHLAGRVVIEDEVFVGTGASFIPKVRVGKGSVVAAGAVVTKDVPPYTLVAGVPAVVKKQLAGASLINR